MMAHHKRLIIVVGVLIAVAAGLVAVVVGGGFASSAGSAPLTPEQQANNLIDELATGSTTADPTSSNPYDYAADNPSMEALVALGTPALTVIHGRLAAARYPEGGWEYLAAIAAERIARIDLKTSTPEDSWDCAQGFLSHWDAQMKAIPERVAEIARSDATTREKTASLAVLGTPALPYILDRVAAGDRELVPAASALARGTVEARTAGFSAESSVTPAWAKEHVVEFEALRALVEAQQ